MSPATYRDFNDYLYRQPEQCREQLSHLHRIILEEIPDAEELFNYNVPAFNLIPGGTREHQIMIAGYRKHVGLYPHSTTMEHFADQLEPYKRGTGSVQFPLDRPLPGELIRAMVKYRKALVLEQLSD